MREGVGTGSVAIRPKGLHWIKGAPDDSTDLCAHGHVEFRILGEVLVHPEHDLEVTVSAAALYLLRTLAAEHRRDSPVGDQLFPCCGFAMFDESGSQDVLILGCPNGLDFEVFHGPGRAHVIVRARDGREWRATWSEWQSAVFAFADAVSEFFAAAAPKTPSPDDQAGFRKFVGEWERRRGEVFGRVDEPR